MENIDIFDLVNFILSISSISLAIVAMIQAHVSAKESRENYQRTKEVLAQIDTRAAVIEATVQKAQDQLMNTVMKIIDELVLPKKEDNAKTMFFKLMQENPQMQDLAVQNFKGIMEKQNSAK
jgi:hypothetical protein